VKRPRTAGEARRALLQASRAWLHGDRAESVDLAAACGPWLGDRQWKIWRLRLDRCRDPELADLIAREVFGVLVQHDRSWLRVLRHWALSPSPRRRRAAVLALLGRVRRMQDAEAGSSIRQALRGERHPAVRSALAELDA
jgi:hypothetical protein